MAGEDYSLKTKVEADVTNFEKGMNKAEKSLKGFSDKLADNINRLGKKGLVGSIANVTLAMQGLTKSFGTVVKFAKDVGEAINECTEAYKTQVIAERALDTAIQNNPFISGESSKALKQFASEMQKVSNYGDEELIPMMTNLVSLGRTESETMQIMSVAMDMSAGMGISLDTAITQLNATLNGNIGRLGQQNAELKGLTEEELKQGRAIEILGEKFKGLSGATADTSKQLKNIKGDFKEALGQFTLPSSDLWNKFWTGFYTKGIEAINKINAFMDSQIIGKKLANAITEQIARINPADIGGRVDYTRSVLKVIGDDELEALKNYLSGLKQLNAEQEIILKRIKAEEDSRYQSTLNAKAEAEKAKERADAEAKVTAELQKQEEISKKKTDWSSKLLDQRIEMLETERDRAMQYAEEEGAETYSIWVDYNNKILELKLERLEKEKEKALAEEGLTADDKVAIEEYYSGETKKIYNDLGDYKKKKKEDEKKDEKSKFALMVEYAKQYAERIKNIFSKIGNTIKDVFSKVTSFVKNVFDKTKNIFTKLFDFNIDDALTALLKVEDAILTFFVETLPKLPQFFESAFSSVLTLIQTLINSIDWDNVKNNLDSIIKTFVTYAPQIVSGIVEIFTNLVTTISTVLVENAPEIVSAIGEMFFTILEALPGLISNFLNVAGTYLSEIGKYITDNSEKLSKDLSDIVKSIVEGISNFIESGGWRNVLSALLTIQNAIQNAITDNLDEIVNTIIEALPDLVDMLIKSIVSASKAMEKVIKPIIKLVLAVIEAIIDVLLSDEVLDAGIEAGMAIMDAIFDELIPRLAKLIPKLIVKIIAFIVKNLPKLVKAMVKGIIKSFTQVNWGQVISDIFTGFIDAIKDLFGIHSPSTLFESFGTYMVEGLVAGLKGISESVMIILQPLVDLVKGLFDGLFNAITEPINKVVDSFTKINELGFETLKETLKTLVDLFTNLSELTFTSIIDLSKMGFDTLIKVLETVSNLFTDISKISFDGLNKSLDSLLGFLKDISKISFTAIVDLAKVSFDGLNNTLNSILSALKDITKISFKTLTDSLNIIKDVLKIISDTATGIIQISFDGFNNGIKAVGESIARITDSVTDLVKALGELAKTATEAVNALNPLQGGGGNNNNTFEGWDLFDPLHIFPGHAIGTNNAQKGLAIVGEAGPELVRFNGGEQVLNSHNTQKALEGMGGTVVNQNVTFNNLQDTSAFAMIQQLKQYNRQMAINGVI